MINKTNDNSQSIDSTYSRFQICFVNNLKNALIVEKSNYLIESQSIFWIAIHIGKQFIFISVEFGSNVRNSDRLDRFRLTISQKAFLKSIEWKFGPNLLNLFLSGVCVAIGIRGAKGQRLRARIKRSIETYLFLSFNSGFIQNSNFDNKLIFIYKVEIFSKVLASTRTDIRFDARITRRKGLNRNRGLYSFSTIVQTFGCVWNAFANKNTKWNQIIVFPCLSSLPSLPRSSFWAQWSVDVSNISIVIGLVLFFYEWQL